MGGPRKPYVSVNGSGPPSAAYPLYGDPLGRHHKFIFPHLLWARPYRILYPIDLPYAVLIRLTEPIDVYGGTGDEITIGGHPYQSQGRIVIPQFPKEERLQLLRSTWPCAPGDPIDWPKHPIGFRGFSGGWTRRNFNYVQAAHQPLGPWLTFPPPPE